MRSILRRFAADRSANIAILSAVAAIPLTLGVGVMVDLATVARMRSHLQNAVDAAALAVAREGQFISDETAYKVASTFLAGNLGAAVSKLSVEHVETSFTVAAETGADISFGTFFGYRDIAVQAKATADIAFANYEVGLVLDTTGSMQGGKIAAMKDAVIGLIDTLPGQVDDPSQLKMALVPFATFVNVGPQYGPRFNGAGKIIKNSGASWLDLKGDANLRQTELKKGVSRFEAFHNLGEEWAGCVETRDPVKSAAYDVADLYTAGKRESLFVPAFSIDEPDTAGFDNNYIASNVDPLDTTSAGQVRKLQKYGAAGATIGLNYVGDVVASILGWFPVSAEITASRGPNAGCDMQPITPLTSNYAELRRKVLQLNAAGTTNIMEGVAWGARVLSPGVPFTEGADPAKDPNLRKVMIVLTDGTNNFGPKNNSLGSSYSSFGYRVDDRLPGVGMSSADPTRLMNDKTLAACTAAKKAGIEIFTIRLEEPDRAVGTLLQQCASDPSHFLDVPSRAQLDDAFQAIRSKMTQIRITS